MILAPVLVCLVMIVGGHNLWPRFVFFSAGFAILILVHGVNLAARWLARPLSELERGVTRFAKGDHTTRVSPSGSRETRAVAAAFNDGIRRAEALSQEKMGKLTAGMPQIPGMKFPF